MFQIKVNGKVVKEVRQPYAIVLKDGFTVVRIGEKEDMEHQFEEIMKRIRSYEPNAQSHEMVHRVYQILEHVNILVDKVPITKEEIQELCSEYLLVPIPPSQEEIDRVMDIEGYLKRYYKDYSF